MNIKAIGYCRWSPRPGNPDDVLSNEKQKERIVEYCQQKNYDLLDVVLEPDTSGGFDENNPEPVAFYESRPKLFDAIAQITRDMVLVMRWRHRAARSVHGQGIVRMEIARRGARWEATDEPNDESPEGRFVQQIYASMAELNRWQLKIATARAMRKYQNCEGRRMSRLDRCPWGTRPDPNDTSRLIPDIGEEETAKLVLEQHAKGSLPGAICRYLDQVDRPRRGKTWQAGRGTVLAIIRRAEARATKLR